MRTARPAYGSDPLPEGKETGSGDSNTPSYCTPSVSTNALPVRSRITSSQLSLTVGAYCENTAVSFLKTPRCLKQLESVIGMLLFSAGLPFSIRRRNASSTQRWHCASGRAAQGAVALRDDPVRDRRPCGAGRSHANADCFTRAGMQAKAASVPVCAFRRAARDPLFVSSLLFP